MAGSRVVKNIHSKIPTPNLCRLLACYHAVLYSAESHDKKTDLVSFYLFILFKSSELLVLVLTPL